jgi:hypothetical protein
MYFGSLNEILASLVCIINVVRFEFQIQTLSFYSNQAFWHLLHNLNSCIQVCPTKLTFWIPGLERILNNLSDFSWKIQIWICFKNFNMISIEYLKSARLRNLCMTLQSSIIQNLRIFGVTEGIYFKVTNLNSFWKIWKIILTRGARLSAPLSEQRCFPTTAIVHRLLRL